MDEFYVIGGEYTDTTFKHVLPNTYEEYGPMSYDEAQAVWHKRAWATVDNALYRFRIVSAHRKE